MLPAFRYHPDPIATGSVKLSRTACVCCEQARGFIYVGPVFAEEDLDEELCPWCIADGSAAAKFNAVFTDPDSIGDHGMWPSVSPEVTKEVATRTPGFSGWQQERWFTCCRDAALFLGRMGHEELEALGDDALVAIQRECGLEGEQWVAYLKALDSEGSPTAYVFRCAHCNRLGGYSDCD